MLTREQTVRSLEATVVAFYATLGKVRSDLEPILRRCQQDGRRLTDAEVDEVDMLGGEVDDAWNALQRELVKRQTE